MTKKKQCAFLKILQHPSGGNRREMSDDWRRRWRRRTMRGTERIRTCKAPRSNVFSLSLSRISEWLSSSKHTLLSNCCKMSPPSPSLPLSLPLSPLFCSSMYTSLTLHGDSGPLWPICFTDFPAVDSFLPLQNNNRTVRISHYEECHQRSLWLQEILGVNIRLKVT